MERGAAALNLLKAWFFVAVLATVLGALGWLIGGTTAALLFAFCSLLAATGVYRYGDRALLGMLGARPFALAEDQLFARLPTPSRQSPAYGHRSYLIADGFPRSSRLVAARRARALAVSTGAVQALGARSSKRRSRTSSPMSPA